MSDCIRCSKCDWWGPLTPLYGQFDKYNRCFHCQPPKKEKKKKHVELEKKYVKDNVNYEEE